MAGNLNCLILSGHSDPDPSSVKDLLKESLNHNNNEIGILLTYVCILGVVLLFSTFLFKKTKVRVVSYIHT